MHSLTALVAIWALASIPLGFGLAALAGRNRS